MFDLRPNYDGGNEDKGQPPSKGPMHAHTHALLDCPQPSSRPPLTHTSTGNSWMLMHKSESVSCGVTAPFSWVLVCTGFVWALSESVYPVLCKFWWLCGGVNGDLLQNGLLHPEPLPHSSPLLTRTSAGDTQHSSGSVSGSWCAQFHPSYHLAGLLLCPWMWGIFLVGSNISPVNSCQSLNRPQR